MCHWLAAPVLWLTYFKQLWIIWIARVFVYVYDCLWQLLSHNSGFLNLQLLWFKMSILFINVFIKILLAGKFFFLFTLLVFPGFSHELQGVNFKELRWLSRKYDEMQMMGQISPFMRMANLLFCLTPELSLPIPNRSTRSQEWFILVHWLACISRNGVVVKLPKLRAWQKDATIASL